MIDCLKSAMSLRPLAICAFRLPPDNAGTSNPASTAMIENTTPRVPPASFRAAECFCAL